MKREFKVGDLVWSHNHAHNITGYHIKCTVIEILNNRNFRITPVEGNDRISYTNYDVPKSNFEHVNEIKTWNDILGADSP